MTTKETHELEPGDVVVTSQGIERTILSVREATEQGVPTVWDVEYVVPEVYPQVGAWATRTEQWQLAEPSKLDLAVRRAQELADQWPNGVPNTGYALATFDRLLDLFRAAR